MLDRKVLVTGGTGMIGRQLVDLLLQRGAIVRVASLDDPINLPDGVEFMKADLTDFTLCLEVCEGMDYVFNLVGVKGSPKMCQEKPASFMVPMLMFNTNMMEAARRCDVKWYLYTSTVGVYEPAEILREDDVWKTFPSPNDRFAGWAKRIGELQAEAYSIQYGWDKVSIVRPANVYGPFDNFDPESAMVIPSLIRKAYENDVLSVWGDGSPVRDFIHARDVARGMLYAVEYGITDPVNLGSGEGYSIKEIAEIIAKRFSKEISWDASKPQGDAKRILSMERITTHGFEVNTPLEFGIDETIDWFLENKDTVDQRHDEFR
jgi:GDP-L-fucose synthase